MKLKKIGLVSFLLFFLSFFLCVSDVLTQNLEKLDPEKIEKFLKKAKVVSIQTDRGRRTESWEVDLDDGKIQGRGFFKLTNRDWSNPSGGDSYRYVLAGYELDKMLDLNLVPPTVERKIDKQKGSLMLFLSPPIISEEERMQKNLIPPDPDSFNKTMSDLVIFEHLLYFPSLCNQRDLGNILTQTEESWKVWLVDLSEAFAPATKLIPGCEITGCSDILLNKLENISNDKIQTRLSSYLSDKEITALLVRKDLIIKKVKELRSKKK